MSWASLVAIQLRGRRAAQAFARDVCLVLHFSEMAQALREAHGSDRAQLRRLVAAVRSLYEVVCVNGAIFNP